MNTVRGWGFRVLGGHYKRSVLKKIIFKKYEKNEFKRDVTISLYIKDPTDVTLTTLNKNYTDFR